MVRRGAGWRGAGREEGVTQPEDAQEQARRSAELKRAEGRYADTSGSDPLDDSILGGKAPAELLSEWAVIEIEPDLLYSTRRGGAPITALKRLLLRLMRQHLVELEARQTRFNLGLLAAFEQLERRVETLEGAAEDRAGRDE